MFETNLMSPNKAARRELLPLPTAPTTATRLPLSTEKLMLFKVGIALSNYGVNRCECVRTKLELNLILVPFKDSTRDRYCSRSSVAIRVLNSVGVEFLS